MDCPQCAHRNRDGSRFCGECGAALVTAQICTRCARENPAGQKFCDGCGTRLTAAPAAAPSGGATMPAPATRPDPRSYTPAHLAEKILTSRSAVEGERKQVTVLFSDVKGSMDLVEETDPEEWHGILDRFFTILSEGIHRFEGTINQFTGDGVMALFGAPIAHEDHARRACYAALAISEDLARYSAELRRTRGLNFSVRMGLNSGEVVVGKIGDDLRMDYTAQGRTVGLAARIEQIAAPDRIYLTESTAELAAGFVRLKDLGHFEIKGAREPVHVFELEGVGPMRTRLDVSRARGFSRFVGRAAENAALDEALARALEGQGQVVGIVAEPGVGKSRLSFEFAERARAKGVVVHEGHGVAHGKTVPFLPVLEFLRGYFGITERDADEEARRKVAGTLVLLDEGLRDNLPLVFEFLGVPDPERPAPRIDPEARQRQLFAMLRRLLQARSRKEPAVLLFEDLHWIDGATEAYLQTVAESLGDTRTLLLVNYRPEYRPAWLERPNARELALEPLGEREVGELLETLLGTDPSLDGLAQRIRARTGGNPFFVEEVVQSLVESGALDGARGRHRLTRTIDELAIPASVQAVLAARIDRLPERDKVVLQTAAVVGKEVAEPVLRRVAGVSDAEMRAALQGLVRAELLHEHALFPEAVYAFKHPLTQDVAYHSQLSERRGRVHAAVARAIAEIYPDKLDPQAALVAHHWERAGERLEGARWSARAAEWAERSDISEAVRHWRKVRELLVNVAETTETMTLRRRTCSSIMSLGIRLGDPENETRALYAEGRALSERLGDPRSLGLLEAAYCGALTSLGDADEAIEHGRIAKRIGEELGDPEYELALAVPVVYAYEVAGRMREALEVTEQALANAPADPRLGAVIIGFSPYAQLRFFRGSFLLGQGRLDESRADLDEAIRIAGEIEEPEVAGLAHGFYAILARCLGDLELARRHSREAIELAERIGSPLSRAFASRALGSTHLMAEEWEDAIRALETALTISRKSRTAVWADGYALADMAEAYAGLGQFERARAIAEQALELSRKRGTKTSETHACLAFARVLLASEGAEAAPAIEAALDRALEAAANTWQVVYRPQIAVERGRLAALQGDEKRARSFFTEAHGFCRTMGAHAAAALLAGLLGMETAAAAPGASVTP